MRLPKGIREIKRQKLHPINVVPGDTINLYDGKTVVMSETVTKPYLFTEGVLFETDAGVLGEGRALGGAFIEEKK